MPFVPVPDALEVRLLMTLGSSEEMVNVLHYHNLTPTPMTQVAANHLGNEIWDKWDVNMGPVVSTEVAFQAITVKDISAPDLPVFIVPIVNSFGAAAGDPLPYQTSLVATLRTESGTRGGRGRTYLGGFVAAGLDTGDAADGAVVDACLNFMNAIQNFTNLGGVAGEDYNLGVVSRFAHVGGDPNGAPIAPIIRDVAAINVNRRWDTQRRRSNRIRI